MNIRRSRLSDAPALARLARSTIRSINALDHAEEIIDAWAKGNTAKAYRAMEKERIRFVAVEKNRVVGFTDMLKDGELMSLYVDKDFLRKGIGRRLLTHIEFVARRMRIKRMYCQSSVNAKAFYEKHGYRVLRSAYWKIPGVPRMRVYKMAKDL